MANSVSKILCCFGLVLTLKVLSQVKDHRQGAAPPPPPEAPGAYQKKSGESGGVLEHTSSQDQGANGSAGSHWFKIFYALNKSKASKL